VESTLITNNKLETSFLSKEKEKKLKVFQEEIIKNNQKLNLISKSSVLNLWERHIIDSAQLINFFPKGFNKFIDIGSGAGFPGLVIKIMDNNLKGHLVESNTKKANFLSNTSELLGIDINVHNERFENLDKFKNDNKFVLTSRAVSNLNKMIKISLSFFQSGSIGLFHKGEKWQQEISEASKFWAFEFESIVSLTNKDSRIIMIKNVVRK
tara:strand:+ start:4003 stop:4632 length:630 start_codon:yes stop_codon:yes gene_type:complete